MREFDIRVYHKSTFTGVLSHFNSIAPLSRKPDIITCLLHGAFLYSLNDSLLKTNCNFIISSFKPVFLNLFGARTPQNFVKRFRTTYRIRLIQSNNKVKHNVACYRCIRVKRKLTVINRLIFINRNVAHNEKRN